MASSNIKGITIEIDGNTSKLSSALRDVNKEARETDNALKDIQKTMKLDSSGSTKLMVQQQRELGNAIENTKKKLELLKTAQSQMSSEYRNTEEGARAYDNLTREITATESQLKSLENQAKKSNQVIKSISDTSMKVSKVTGEMGSKLTKGLTAPIVGLGGLVTKTASDFDDAMNGVSKTVDMSESEFTQMGKSIRDMAKTMPQSAVEIANVAESAGQLGIEKENVVSFAKTMMDLGVSTNLTADEAAVAFAKFANITQMPEDKFQNLGSVVVELGNNLATTEKDIVELGTRLASAGSQAGLTDAEIMGLAGAMSSVGLSAEAGGSAMTQVLTKIGTSVSMGDDKLKIFAQTAGMTADEFASKWESSPREAIQAFIDGLGDAKDSGENVDLILKELGITGIRETDTLKRLAGSGDLLKESFDMANESFEENTALSKEAEKKYDSFSSKLGKFKNKIKDIGITIGDVLMPHIENATDKLSEFADSFSKIDPSVIEKGLGFIGLVAIIGPVLLIISKIAGVIGTVSGAVGIMTGAITTGTPVMRGFATVFGGIGKVVGLVKTGFMAVVGVLGGPLTVAIGAVIGIIILMATHWEETKEIAGNVVDFISEKWQEFTSWFGQVWDGIKEAWSEFWDGLGNWFAEKWNAAVEVLEPYLETFKNIFTVLWLSIQEIFTFAWELITGILVNSWNFISDTAKFIWEGIKNLFLMFWDPISEKISEVWNAITEFLGGIWEGLKTNANEKFGAIKDNISEIWDSIKSFTSEKWEAIKGVLGPIWDGLTTSANDKFTSMKNTISEKWEAIKTKTSDTWDNIKSKTSSAWDNIKDKITNTSNNIKSGVTPVFDNIKDHISGVWSRIKNNTSDKWNAIKSTISDKIGAAKDAVKSGIDKIKSFLNISLPTPSLKLPHPSVSGKFSLNPPQVPHFSIDWYKKGGIFTKPTFFNTPYGLKGVGEAGAEAVLPIEKLTGIVTKAMQMNAENSDENNSGIVITGNTFNVREEADIEKIAQKLYRLIEIKNRGKGIA